MRLLTGLLVGAILGLGCSSGGGTPVASPNPLGVPVISSLTATPSAITAGQGSTLAWSVSGATSLSINQGIGAVTGTTHAVTPATTTTYTLTATSPAGNATATSTITVTADTQAPTVPANLVTSSVTETSLTLTWSASTDNVAVTSYRVYRGGTLQATVANNSFSATGLMAATTYSFTVVALDAAGNLSEASVPQSVTTPLGLPVIASFTATPRTLTVGQSSTLAWTVSGATSLSLSGIGNVTGTTSRVVTPTANTTYTLTATNAAGSRTAQVAVTVSTDTGLPQIRSFAANPARIVAGGRTTLFWEAANADHFTLNQFAEGNVTATHFPVHPRVTTTYLLFAHNANGRVESTCTVTVDPAPAIAPTLQPFETASDRILVVVVDSGPHLRTEAVIDTGSSQWLVDGVRPASVHSETIVRDEDEATTGSGGAPDIFPVHLRHRVYLTLSQALIEGRTYRVTTPYGERSLVFSDRTVRCSSLKVNQVGYHPASTRRYAAFGIYRGDGGSMRLDAPLPYDVLEVATGRSVATGTLRYIADESNFLNPNPGQDAQVMSGEHVYHADLAAVPSGGPYVVRVIGAGHSWPFRVSQASSRELAYVHTRGMYHQRCGIALESPYTTFTRPICHTHVGQTRTQPWTADGWITVPPGTDTHPIQGGYHDAGDFDRRPMHTQIPIEMLGMFEAFPSHFTDRQYNIPESGNGIPDFLDEALWGTLIWQNLQEADGSILAGTEASGHPTFGAVSAATDYFRYGTWGTLPHVTAFGTGMFAQASRLIRPYDAARADALLAKAQLSWTRTLALETTLRNEAPQALMYAALQMYLATATGNAAADLASPAHVLFRELAQRYIASRPPTYPAQFIPGNPDAWFQMHHFGSYLLTNHPTDAALRQALIDEVFFQTDVEGTFFGPIDNDPYPVAVNKYLGWGSGTAQGRTAYVYCYAYRLSTDATRRQHYFDVVSQLADASVGLNPLGKSFVTGLGSDAANSPLHADSYFTKYGLGEHLGQPKGNVPGIIVYGPTTGRSGATYQTIVSDKLYPLWDQLPPLRRYGDGWSLVNSSEFTTWETMVWNVCMHGFLYDASADH